MDKTIREWIRQFDRVDFAGLSFEDISYFLEKSLEKSILDTGHYNRLLELISKSYQDSKDDNYHFKIGDKVRYSNLLVGQNSDIFGVIHSIAPPKSRLPNQTPLSLGKIRVKNIYSYRKNQIQKTSGLKEFDFQELNRLYKYDWSLDRIMSEDFRKNP